MKHEIPADSNVIDAPAAFGRLCVETLPTQAAYLPRPQPPSGGCVLKHAVVCTIYALVRQPPSGGCVLKRCESAPARWYWRQPPSGGCVLKPLPLARKNSVQSPAAFGRLCVETVVNPLAIKGYAQPPSGGCVLKPIWRAATITASYQPPSGGCVLKLQITRFPKLANRPAAFGRLCVET